MKVLTSIKAKLILSMLTISLLVIVIFSISLIKSRATSANENAQQSLTILSNVIANNSKAALLFNDPASAEQTLSALQFNPDIIQAELFVQDGTAFARYLAEDDEASTSHASLKPSMLLPSQHFIVDRQGLHSYTPISSDGELIGTLHIIDNRNALTKQINKLYYLVATISVITFLLSIVLMLWLQSFFTKPLSELIKVMQYIVTDNDYSQRVRIQSNDEFSTLADNFNNMVTEIELRDQKLAAFNRDLQQEVIERKQAEEKLKLAASVFIHARESIIISDATGTIIDVNDTFSQATGYSREEAIGHNSRFLKSGRQSPEFYVSMWQSLQEKGYWYGEMWNRRKNGEVFAEMKAISAVHDEHDVTTHYVALGTDITVMKSHQDQLEHIANYDILTNLPNRSLLADRLSQAMVQSRRHGNSIAVVFLDLDGFKAINDAHGHAVGDKLLTVLSLRMKEVLREGDTLARIGGDEFIAVLADLVNIEDCEPVLDRFLLAASEPIYIDDTVLNVSASIGVAIYPQDNVDADLLMRHADQAMYVAKESGKNRYHLFDTAYDDAVKVQRESLEAIRHALDNHQFVLYYQPKVNLRTGTVTGVEALIRWQHPKRGLLTPIEFLPIIENNAMSIEMGEWVIDTALIQISQWQEMGLNLPLNISVNIAAVQLQQSDFTDRLARLLAAHPNVEPRHLELEVLETSAIDDIQHLSIIMNACVALGVNFSLDDFGTGYSSLTYLRRLPANLIKIDQSFVRDMLSDPDDLAIVKSVIALAKSFTREVIAEGVETIEHGTLLLQLGCELAQGYGIARPMPAGDFPAWVSEWQPDAAWQSQKIKNER